MKIIILIVRDKKRTIVGTGEMDTSLNTHDRDRANSRISDNQSLASGSTVSVITSK